MIAVLFPGQGSQYVGMASDLYKKYDLVKKIFETIDNKLGYSLSNIILNGPESELKLTQNTQPAIMATSVSIFNVLLNHSYLNLKESTFYAGHSLGEYTALVCAGSLTLENAAYLLHERGKAMQDSVPTNIGGMIAVLGMSIQEVENEINLLPKNIKCEIANDNCIGQVVVSGVMSGINTLKENLKKKGKKGIVLPVSAPFHCSLMQKAAEVMESKIQNTNFLTPKPYIISNVTAKKESAVNDIKSLLVDQITTRVRWRESVEYMINQGVKNFIEIGPGKVLSGLVKKISKDLKIRNINNLDDLNT